MKNITLDLSGVQRFVDEHEVSYLIASADQISNNLDSLQGPGSDFMGWVKWPFEYDTQEVLRIHSAVKNIQKQSQVLVVVGIGGSYLGALATIEALNKKFPSQQQLEIIFAGHTISSTYTAELLSYLEDKDFSINVISKSGTTTEPAIAFRLLRALLNKKYGVQEARKRIYATTDLEKGALRSLAVKEGYEMFSIPGNVGGRFSVATAVGLLPMAAAGIDIDQFLSGATASAKELRDARLEENPAVLYGTLRHILYNKGKDIELFVSYEPQLRSLGEWYKQLFGESEGKDQKGIFPASAIFSTDLHSLGQYVQDGKRHLFETVVCIENPRCDCIVPYEEDDIDQLNYIAGKGMDFINKKAAEGTKMAHIDGGIPVIQIKLPQIDAFYFGYLLYFLEKTCAISGTLLGVNPFDQPGVEAYKSHMFELLGKK